MSDWLVGREADENPPIELSSMSPFDKGAEVGRLGSQSKRIVLELTVIVSPVLVED
jgi:hypothetical protein